MERIETVIAEHWRRLWLFACRITLDRVRARELLEETFLRAYVGLDKMPSGPQAEPWLLKIAGFVAEKQAGNQAVSFDLLDETLRSEATRTEAVSPLSEPERNFLLWELKQGCMTAVINCLPPGERVAFAMSVILGIGEEQGAVTLGIKTSAYKVRLSRARKKVADYLAPRCEHVDPANPCHCPSRLGVALDKGFVRAPGAAVQIRPSFGRYGASLEGEDAPLRDVMAIYNSLPDPEPPEDLLPWLLGRVSSPEWNEVRRRSRPTTDDGR